MLPCRPALLAIVVVAAIPLQASAKENSAAAIASKNAAQAAETLPAPIRNAMLDANSRQQYVAATVEFARTAAGRDGILTEADLRKFKPGDPRAEQIRYYLKAPLLKRYHTPRKLGSRSVPRISVRKMGLVAETVWDTFDVNRDGTLSDAEKAPLRLARGGASGGRPPMW